MDKFRTALLGVAIAAVLVPLVAIPYVLLRGLALHLLWGWFLTPTFQIPSPSIPMCIGITVTVISLFPARALDERPKPEYREGVKWEHLAHYYFSPILAIGIGWIVRQFV